MSVSKNLFPDRPLTCKDVADIKNFKSIYQASLDQNDAFWDVQARALDWFAPYHTVNNSDFERGRIAWYIGGKLNLSYNCVDRHMLAGHAQKTALVWAQDEPGQYESITYEELYESVCKMANALKSQGVQKGDIVCLYMSMTPQAVVSMLACARIGAIHTVVFAGFGSEALRDRIEDAQAKWIVTSNESCRGGKKIALKVICDEAIKDLSIVEKVWVYQRTNKTVPMQAGRDVDLEQECEKQRPDCPVEWMDAEDPLFILYTSGSTGKPKGLIHTTGGYGVYTNATFRWAFDPQPDDVFMCAADIGWITGHSYIVYGPLSHGTTTVLFESTPTYPDMGRYWQVIEDLKVSIFYTAPTALRAIASQSKAHLEQYDCSSLRVLGSVGEPINPEIWRWYHEEVGQKKAPVVDTWWQTETGGILITPLPGITPPKPGSACFPLFGVQTELLSGDGEIIEGPGEGALCIARSWPGQARTIFKDHQRFCDTYLKSYKGYYFSGDGARRDQDGYIWVTGRMDDVINVSGHRLGTAEVESSLVAHAGIAEAAVVGVAHDIKGTAMFAFIVNVPERTDDENQTKPSHEEWTTIVKNQVQGAIGGFARPDYVMTVSELPKTRSGKVMRRILRKIAVGEFDQLGDLSTLANPECVDALIEYRKKLQN